MFKRMRASFLIVAMLFTLTACHKSSQQTIDMTPDQVKILYDTTGIQVLGAENAPVTMVEIFAYDCRYCRQDAPLIARFAKEHPGVRMIFKSFMAFGDKTKVLPQYAALAAAKQGKFLAMHEALMGMHHPFILKYIDQIAQHLNLNMTAFHQDLNDPSFATQIQNNTTLMDNLNINGIPTVIMTQTRLAQSPQDVDKIPQYIQNVQ